MCAERVWSAVPKCRTHPRGVASASEDLPKHTAVTAQNSQPKYLDTESNSAAEVGDAVGTRS